MIGFRMDPEIKHMLEAMRAIDKKYCAKAMLSATVYAIKPVKDEIKRRVPVITGVLRKSIGHRSLNLKEKRSIGLDQTDLGLFVGPTRKAPDPKMIKPVTRMLWVEEGTKPHTIVAKNRKALKMGYLFYKSVEHPGATPYKVLQPALNATSGQVEQRFYDGLDRFLDRTLKK